MRKQVFLSFIILLIINSGCKKNPYNDHHLKADLQKVLDKHLANFKSKFPGKQIGFGLYIKGPGKSDVNNVYISSGFPEAYGSAIQFRGASTTKTFTAAAILKLCQQNKLKLDDLITANIPGTNKPYIPATGDYAIPNKNKITIRLLLQHRAGVFDITNTEIPVTANAPYAGQRYLDYASDHLGANYTFGFPELINVVAVNHLSYFEPGTAFHYSNTGYNLLAVIIERISGKRYDQFLQDEFLNPLQLNHTRFPYLGTDQQLPQPSLSGWLNVNDELIEIDDDNLSSAVSEGNIITTPADLATWSNALYGSNTILNAGLHAQMIDGIPTNEEHVSYALGTERNPPDLGYGHNGARPPYMITMRYHPGTKTSYVVFCNFLDTGDFQAQADAQTNIVREAIKAVESLR
ncbi:MAG: serine hydrolase domain-containing protein [Ferruginibacter sp.]